jgi:P-type Cu+ transporter
MSSIKKATLTIVDMHCTSCALTIDMDLEEMPGVKKSKTSYVKSVTEVEYDENQVTIATILATIAKSGYTTKV